MVKKRYIALIVVLLMILGSAGLFVANTSFGFSTLSLDQVDLQSSFSFLDGKVWVFTFSQGGLGQNAIFGRIVTPDDASSKYSGNEAPEETFNFEVTYDKQECQYLIQQTDYSTSLHDGQIYDLKHVEWNQFGSCDFSQESETNRCGLGWSSLLSYEEIFDISGKCNIICGLRRTGNIGRLESPQVNAKFTAKATSQGQTYQNTFETLGETKGFLKDSNGVHGPVYLIYQFSGVTGKACADKDPYRPIYRSGAWQIVDSNKYSVYSQRLDDLLSTETNGNDDLIRRKIDEVNIATRDALNTVNPGNLETSSSESGFLLMDIQDQDIIKPVITAYIEADWIKINTPIGKPRITVGDISFRSGAQGIFAVVKVENIGNELGTFNIFGNCQDNRVEIKENKDVSVQPGDYKEVNLKVAGDVSEKITTTCTMTAKGTQYSDSDDFKVTVDIAGQVCMPNQKVCKNDGNIYQCNSAGSSDDTLIKTCTQGCDYAAGQPYCKEDTPPPDKKSFLDRLFGLFNLRNPFAGFLGTLALIQVLAGVIVFGLVFFYMRNIITKKEKTRKDPVNLVFYLIISIAAGILVYLTLWSIVIIGILALDLGIFLRK